MNLKWLIFPLVGGIIILFLILAGLLWLNTRPDSDITIEIEVSPTLPPIQVEVEAVPTATPTLMIPPTATGVYIPPISAENNPVVASQPTIQAIPETNLMPATLPVADWGSAENTFPELVTGGAGCILMTSGPDTYVNVRDYPSTIAGIQRTIEPNTQHRVIAIAVESDGTWYGLERGWVGGSVVNVFGDSCSVLPNASKVVWRSFGHVDFANLEKYREVRNIQVEEYMLNYPMLIFENGTIWHNPNAWQNP